MQAMSHYGSMLSRHKKSKMSKNYFGHAVDCHKKSKTLTQARCDFMARANLCLLIACVGEHTAPHFCVLQSPSDRDEINIDSFE